MPWPRRYSQIAWVMARMCASLKEPRSEEPRCPLVPKLTHCAGSPVSGVRPKYSRSRRARSTSISFGAGFPASGESVAAMVPGSPLRDPALRAGSRPHVARGVPEADRGLGRAVVVAELREARRAEQEAGAGGWLEPEPAGRERAQEVPAREEQHVARERADALHDAVGAGPDLRRRLAAGAAVDEDQPIGPLGVDLGAGAPLVAAVVPLDQIGIDLGLGPEARQLAGARRAHERAREHLDEGHPAQPLAEAAGVALAALGQRKVGAARVLSRDGPGRLAVSREMGDRKRLAHARRPSRKAQEKASLGSSRRPGRAASF